MKKFYKMLYGYEPYTDFDADNLPVEIEGWNSDSPVFSELIRKVKPQRIIEIGTWKGASAINMAQLARKYNIDTEIICVDTFLGWAGADMQTKNGFPILYWQFLTNVIKSGLSDVIIPFPQTSELAATFCRNNNLQADMIYIDGSHYFNAVFDDLVRWWLVVKIGGYLFGDDYTRSDVNRAVTLFVEVNQLELEVFDEKWVIAKSDNVIPVDAHDFLEKHKDKTRL